MPRRSAPPVAALALVVCQACRTASADPQDESGSVDGTGADDSLGVTAASSSSDGGTMTASSSVDDSSSGGEDFPEPLPPLDAVPWTTQARRLPVRAAATAPESDPREPELLLGLLAQGYADETDVPGEPIIDITMDGAEPPAPGPAAHTVTRFVHLADTQLADDESPTRLISFDTHQETAGAFRPQETWECAILDAAVRTIDAVHRDEPVDFVILGGDNADSAQQNEVQWFVDILGGAPVVHCDSGDDDDPVPGPNNDPKDPFAPVGLDVPWYWVMGNHDVLVQGNLVIEGRQNQAVGQMAPSGTRDWSLPGGPLSMGPIPADDRRSLLDGQGLLELVGLDDDGHGITPEVAATGKANYTFDVGDTDIRVIVVDSAAQTGGSSGLIRQTEVDAFIRPALDSAVTDGMQVVIASHHASGSLSDGSGFGGTAQPDALTPDDWRALLGEYDNILVHLCGHSHVHRARVIEPQGGTPYWEVITSALADFPHQLRTVEIRDEDNGMRSLTLTVFDVGLQGATLAAQGRLRGVADMTSGWQRSGEGEITDRNVRLWIPG